MLVLLLGVFRGASAQVSTTKQPFINRIIFEGNEYYSDDELRKKMSSRPPGLFSIFARKRLDPAVLNRDIANLQAFYRRNGFLDATVELREVKRLEGEPFVDIYIVVVENEPIIVEQMVFNTTGDLEEKDLRKGMVLKEGLPYNPTVLHSDILTIKRHYFDRGHVVVNVEDSVRTEGHKVRIRFDIDPGPIFTIRNIEIEGNVLTKSDIIEKELTIESGDVFQLKELGETQTNLFETGLFTVADLTFRNVDVENKTVDIVVTVRERKSAYVEAGFGVGNVRGSRVIGEWGDRNIFGTGQRLRFKVEYSFGLFEDGGLDFNRWNPRVRFYRYDGEFNRRHVFGTKLLLSLNAFIEKDGTLEPLIVRTRGFAVGARRRLSQYTETTIRLSDERIERAFVGQPSEKSTSIIFANLLSHDTRNFILDPRSGGYRDARVSLAGGFLGGDNDFYTIESALQRYLPIGGGVVFAARLRGGFADAYGDSPEVPVENRFFTGGGNSVRGFRENSLGPVRPVSEGQSEVVGGQVLLLTNIELRFPLPYFSRWKFTGATFFDGGNAWEDFKAMRIKDFRLYANESEITETDVRYSVGLGIRYNTPVGPIRLDFAVPIKKEPDVGSSRFHFSLGQIF